ncbi:type IV secretion system DNA-binding domain-containing protein [Mucilaginibacter sp. AW1-7]|uniref:type IV secretion system DNA-binding domain-containing protein n=1 Tax=Mucilaginibacter sp. AW1-7 TaxID=3349874 RepID=UPI003F73FD00
MTGKSVSRRLTEQFYEWEKWGRGHAACAQPVQLEPPYVPFPGHFLRGGYVDDGQRHTPFSRLAAAFRPVPPVNTERQEAERPVAYVDDDEYPSLTVFSVTLPRGYAPKGDGIPHLLAMLARCETAVSFELVATHERAFLQFVCRDETASYVYPLLRAYLPDCAVTETLDDELFECARLAEAACVADFGLREEFTRPIATATGGHDPYVPLFGTVSGLAPDEALAVQVLFCGAQNRWADSMIEAVGDGRGGSFFMDAPEMPGLAREKASRPLFGATLRVAAFAEYEQDAARLLHHASLAVVHASASPHNSLVMLDTPEYSLGMRLSDLVLRQSHRVGMLLNSHELATFVHLPDARLSAKLIGTSRTTKAAPRHLHGLPYALGVNEHQGKAASVGLGIEHRLRHIHIIGGTGTGKSTLLANLIRRDIISGTGCCVLDPHGDLIDAMLKAIPRERTGDVLLIDPSDSEFPVAFNILSAHSDLERELLASDLVALFRRFSTSWGDQMHGVLANAIMAFLYNRKPGHIGDLRKFLIETAFRSNVLATCTDTELVYYWQKEYPLLKTSSIGSILTRLDSFLRPRAIRNMVCQHQGVDFGKLMDGGKIILVKLSQGLIGEENGYLLGACIVAKLQQAAMARQRQASAERVPFFCYMDEFHHFVTPSMSTILSGARKYGLGLVCAHQDMQQLERADRDIAGSLMSNAGTRVCFRLSDTDARRMQESFASFSAADMQSLAIGEAIARVGTADGDFNLKIVPDVSDCEDSSSAVIEASRSAYTVRLPTPPTGQPPPPDMPEQAASESAPFRPAPPSARARQPKEQKQEPSADTVTEHRHVQAFVKMIAEQHGYRASVEVPTPDGKGKVDVLLERDGRTIAVEISVSTPVEWELHNVQKCIAAGYDRVVVCAGSPRKLQQVEARAMATLTPSEISRLQFMATDRLPTLFADDAKPTDTNATMKGYRVRVKYDGARTQAETEEIIGRIVRQSGK